MEKEHIVFFPYKSMEQKWSCYGVGGIRALFGLLSITETQTIERVWELMDVEECVSFLQ